MPTRAELIWDGKYDANGKRVVPLRVALPFQIVETTHAYADAGEYRVVVKVIDILGNDTTKTVKVKVK